MPDALTLIRPVEFQSNFGPRREISHVIFDFDGTLSWLRHGWPRVMLDLFREYYPVLPGETETEIREFVLGEILALNGRQSIHQMEWFAGFAASRGANSPTPAELLEDYQRRLDRLISERTHSILSGEAAHDAFVIAGARTLLEMLKQRELTLIILSGTIEHRVREEAVLLDLSRYFQPRIYGGTVDPAKFSKRMVIDRILREEGIEGRHLLSFGDGPVEIQQTKAVGGLAIAVASDEDNNGSGVMDPHKRKQLLAAGADAVMADYQDAPALIQQIFA